MRSSLMVFTQLKLTFKIPQDVQSFAKVVDIHLNLFTVEDNRTIGTHVVLLILYCSLVLMVVLYSC